MSGYSEKELVAWMKEKDEHNIDKMFGWGIIAAVQRVKANHVILQAYIRHFERGSYIEPQSGEVQTDGGNKYIIENAVLDVPRMSFENARLLDSKSRLRMAMVGGNLVEIEEKVRAVVRSIAQYGPILRPELQMDLALTEANGHVAAGGEIYLNLAKATNFLFNFGGVPEAQAKLGAFFEKKFKALPEEKCIYQLGRIMPGGNEAMRPDEFMLVTHPRDPENLDGEGAIISLIKLEGDKRGTIPSDDTQLKYLIPNDAGKDYSATVMLGSRRLALGQMMHALREVIEDATFELEYKDEGGQRLATGAKMTKGELRIPAQDIEIPDYDGGKLFGKLIVSLRINNVYCNLADELKIEFGPDGLIKLNMTLRVWLGCRVMNVKSENGSLERWADYANIDLENLYNSRFEKFECKVSAGYKLVADEGGELEKQYFEFESVKLPTYVDPASACAGLTEGDDLDPIEVIVGMILLWLWGMQLRVIMQLVSDVGGIQNTISLRSLLEETLNTTFSLPSTVKALIDDTIKFNFGNAIIADNTHLPSGAVAFGRVNPNTISFVIDDLEPILGSGQKHKFNTVPARKGLTWRVESLGGQAGTITPDGEYTAPEAEHIDGLFMRVRVVATDGQFESSALVTVVRQGFMITPLVDTTWGNKPGSAENTVNLQVGALDAAADYEWGFENTDPYGTLKKSEATAAKITYVAGPKSDSIAFSIDVVSARNSATGEKVESVIITELGGRPLSVEIIDADVDKGTVSLRAMDYDYDVTGKTEWRVEYGSGEFRDNVFTVDQTKPAPFVVLAGKWINESGRIHEGFIIIPLPLVENSRPLEVLRIKAV
ncbi:hypothetical protein ODI84_10710 [Pseudomonas putida]|uniref:Ig-like domain-containing protein n=1 Tax=Pseudomonas putida TaxID=303 RepID=UPI002D1EE4E9|nr:hypothetical protein [Pseudomonas putida]MEB3900636.1 hypothetical protein [Pseudomonas putida]